ncbi:MAG: hypothetical protein EAX87_05790 [Candidatus Thorarchaeota archaeon]|nr:hypothetical protein [Candidatus Thorarchaeota archaeon]
MKQEEWLMEQPKFCSLMKTLIAMEVVLFLLGGTLITNLHPLWMRRAVIVVGCTLLVTVVAWIVICKRRT